MPPPPIGFYPWSGGPRVCPGQKFAQVEFVAVLACVLRGAKVKPCIRKVTPELLERLGGEDSVAYEEVAKKEVYGVLRQTNGNGATLTLTNPGDLWVRAVKR